MSYKYRINGNRIKKQLIIERGHICNICGLSKWNEASIPLEVHHKDGNRLNNDMDNLQLLCPNCHALTENFSTKNNDSKVDDSELIRILKDSYTIHEALCRLHLSTSGVQYERARKLIVDNEIQHLYKNDALPIIRYCIDCGKPVSRQSIRCRECNGKLSNINASDGAKLSREELKELIRTTSFTKIGEMFGVSDNAVRKWCDKHDLPRRKKDIKSYSDEEYRRL